MNLSRAPTALAVKLNGRRVAPNNLKSRTWDGSLSPIVREFSQAKHAPLFGRPQCVGILEYSRTPSRVHDALRRTTADRFGRPLLIETKWPRSDLRPIRRFRVVSIDG